MGFLVTYLQSDYIKKTRHNSAHIIHDKFIKDPEFKTYRLSDDDFMFIRLYRKFGDKLFENKNYRKLRGEFDEERIEEEKKQLIWPAYLLEPIKEDDGDISAFIYKESFYNYCSYYSRWWDFCRFFTERDFEYEEYLGHFQNYRKEIMLSTKKFCGDKVYYVDDQSEVLEGIGMGGAWDMSWEETENLIMEKSADLLLDIPRFFKDENYKKEFLKKEKYPLSFFDDFRDLT